MRELEGLSYAELAAALGCTLPAVKSLLVRARIGLAEAPEARDAACSDIRADLAETFERRVRASARARRHMRDCDELPLVPRQALQGSSRELGRADALVPARSPGSPSCSGSAVRVPPAAGSAGGTAGGRRGGWPPASPAGARRRRRDGASPVGGGAVAATATKVAVVVCCVAGVAGGAQEDRAPRSRTPRQARRVGRRARPGAARPGAGTRRTAPHGAARRGAPGRPCRSRAEPATSPAAPATPAERRSTGEPRALSATGGIEAPDEPAEAPRDQRRPDGSPLEPADDDHDACPAKAHDAVATGRRGQRAHRRRPATSRPASPRRRPPRRAAARERLARRP